MAQSFVYFHNLIHNLPFLKEELGRKFPTWRFSYSRPGFVTFKVERNPDPQELAELDLLFALFWGKSLGKCEAEHVDELTEQLYEEHSCKAVHRWDFVGEEGMPGDLSVTGKVLDVMRVQEHEYWFGLRFQRSDENFRPWGPFKGGSPFALPPEAPSRAYLKLMEAIHRVNPFMAEDEVALELGCVPGGASYALLDKGLRVIGVDPGRMDGGLVEQFKKDFIFLNHPVQAIKKKQLAVLPKVDWIVVDMNLAPELSLKETLRLAQYYPDTLKGIFFTLKMGQGVKVEDIEEYKQKLLDSGAVAVEAHQLPSHHKECLLYAAFDS